jgi:class 3 adenylate cyclase
VDLVYGRSDVTHLDLVWDEPSLARFLRELATFTRLILFDKRGVGLSDRTVGVATLEDRMDDIRAVMDAVGSKSAVVFGGSETAPMSILFGATYPDRTIGLILRGGLVRGLWAPDYPWAWTREEHERSFRGAESEWGSEFHINRLTESLAPSRMNDPGFKRWLGRVIRSGASPAAGVALARMNMEIDVRATLSAVHVPTLILEVARDRFVRVENERYLAEHIPGAKVIELPGPDHLAWANPEGYQAQLRAIRQFVSELPSSSEVDRVLTTVLFVDIVGSTRRAAEVGDHAWGQLLGRYFQNVRSELVRFRGREVKTMGDGMMASFDGPTRAIRCASALRDRAEALGLEVRAGLHTGECLLTEGDVRGIAVHIAARVSETAEPGEVLVSGTVRDLSVGSDIRFRDRGAQTFKGLEGEWRTYSVEKP